MSVIDPQTWADAEDGRALRELREAPDLYAAECVFYPKVRRWRVTTWTPMGGTDKWGDTIAAAADACRKALR
jgi:hypothetical protein